MVRSKASFRALREALGYSTQELAAALAVSERSVRRWESPDDENPNAPEGVWLWLENERAQRVSRVKLYADVVTELLDAGAAPECIELPYYLNQAHYEATCQDAPSDQKFTRYTVANAINRELAAVLADKGIEIRFIYPKDSSEQTN